MALINGATVISDRVQDQSLSHDEDAPSVQDDPTPHHPRDTYHFSVYALLVFNHKLVTATITGANGGLIGADAIAFHVCIDD